MVSEIKTLKAVGVIILFIIVMIPGKTVGGSDELKVVQANEIIAKIEEREPVEYTDTIVLGDLDLSSVILPSGVIACPIAMKDCEFRGIVSFNNTIMKEQATFERSKFLKPVYFIQTRFIDGANFDDSQFNETVIFRGAIINQSAEFEDVKFNKFADFGDSRIIADAINFRDAYFGDVANFVSTKFNAENNIFEWSQFNKSAKFWHATFGGDTNFKGAYFGDISDFYYVQFNDTADFSGAQFKKEIFFNDVGFKTIKVQWASIENNLDCNGPAYLKLIKNFKDLEQFEDADSCYYQYRDWRRINRPLEWAKVTDYIAWLSCGYGVRWHHTIFSSIMVVVLFGLYYELFNFGNMLRNLLNKGCKNTHNCRFKDDFKKAVTFSAITLLSLPSDWFPFGKDKYAEYVTNHLAAAIFERIIGWGLMLLLIGTLSRLMVRY